MNIKYLSLIAVAGLILVCGCQPPQQVAQKNDSNAAAENEDLRAKLEKLEAEKAAAEKAAAEKAAAERAAAEKAAAERAAAEKAAAEKAAAEKDPVKQLEQIASGLKGRRQVYIQKHRTSVGGDARVMKTYWSRGECRVESVGFDVQKTDSLVSPFQGIITTKGFQISHTDARGNDEFATEAAARAVKPAREGSKYSDNFTHYYAWQNDEWVYKFSETKNYEGNIVKVEGTAWPLTSIKRPGEPGRFGSAKFGKSIVLFEE